MPTSLVVSLTLLVSGVWHAVDHLDILPWSRGQGWTLEGELSGHSHLPGEAALNVRAGLAEARGVGWSVGYGNYLGAEDVSWSWVGADAWVVSPRGALGVGLRRDQSNYGGILTAQFTGVREWTSRAVCYVKAKASRRLYPELGIVAGGDTWVGQASIDAGGVSWSVAAASSDLLLYGGVRSSSPMVGVVLHLGSLQLQSETRKHSQLGSGHRFALRWGSSCGP